MKKVKSFGLVLMGLLMLGGLLAACGDTTVENAPPLPTVTPGLTPIVPPTTATTDAPGSGATPASNPPTATPGAVATSVLTGGTAGCNAPTEIEGVVQAVKLNAVTVNNQTYAYNPQLLIPNDKAPAVGGPIHLSLVCQNGQLVVAKIIAQGPKAPPDQPQNQPGNDDGGDKGKGKDDGNGKGKPDDHKPHK